MQQQYTVLICIW